LYSEFRAFFPKMLWSILSATMITTSRRRIFPQSDTYIEKDSSINEEIDRLRLSTTRSLLERRM